MYFTNENNYFELEDYNDIDFKINDINYSRQNKEYDLEEGFNKGNLFEDLYSKYKNHVYKLKVSNDKDRLLYMIQIYCFAIKDMNLYLDVHPNDKNSINKINEYIRKSNELKKKYNNLYGPLEVNDLTSDSKWMWINNPWPWDKGEK